jgi:ribosome recycling factor
VSTTPCLYKKSKPNPAKPSTGKSKASDSIGTTDAGADVAGVLERTKGKMGKAVEWAKVVVYDGVERGRGRVSPGE